MRNRTLITITGRNHATVPLPPMPAPEPPSDHDEAMQRARYETETARAEAARLKREIDEIKKALPTEEQRARWAELETAAQTAEEQRRRKEGDFESLARQSEERHQKALEAERQMRENVAAQQAATEKELVETLIGRSFADASNLFGPAGKTVLLPEIAASHFANHVEVEMVPGVGGSRPVRRVVVKDRHGAVIVDTKTGRPMPFAAAMEELIDSHPQRDAILRGSGKVGANSPGGVGGPGGGVDLRNLKAKDFLSEEVREAVRQEQGRSGGIQIGPAFDRMRTAGRKAR